MIKFLQLVLLSSLLLLANSVAEGHKDIAHDTEANEPEDIPCPVQQCEGNCTNECMHNICPEKCEEDSGCDMKCKMTLINKYRWEQMHQQFHKFTPDMSQKPKLCPYQDCIEDDNTCNWKCTENFCPEDCKKETKGDCDQHCKITLWRKEKARKMSKLRQESGDEINMWQDGNMDKNDKWQHKDSDGANKWQQENSDRVNKWLQEHRNRFNKWQQKEGKEEDTTK